MTKQRLHSQLAPIDLLTREELAQELHQNIDAAIRERVRGLDVVRVPSVPIAGNSGTLSMFTGNDSVPWGPEQGDIWMLRRVIVKSTLFTDNARYYVFRGSTPSDTANQYSARQLLEGIIAPVAGITNTPASPAIGASPYTYVNYNLYPVNILVTGGTVSQVSINGQNTGITSGNFYIQPGQYITVTYSVAPTFVVQGTGSTLGSTLGQNVNIGYYFATKSVFLQPGEQIYAQVTNSVSTAQYILDAEALRCPAEMKGKLL